MKFSRFFSTVSVLLLVGISVDGLKLQLHGVFEPIGSIKSLARRASAISTPFNYDAPHFSYYVDILLGSAHSFLRLRLSSDPFTWVPGPLPSKGYCAPETNENFGKCIQSNWSGTFDPKTSSSFNNLSASLNLTGSDSRYYVHGYYGEDTIQIGQTPISNVAVGVAWDYTRTPELGLGVTGNTQTTILQTMYDSNLIDVIAYGLYLNDYNANNSELTIGAIDTGKFNGNLITFNSSGTTNVQLNSFLYGGNDSMTELASGLDVNIEFSTGLMYFPSGAFQAVVASVAAYLDSTYGSYLCDCKWRYSDLQFNFMFTGMNITVDATQFIVPAINLGGTQAKLSGTNQPACVLLLDSMTNYGIAEQLGYSAVLGMPFARAAYIVHDFTNKQTSFAQAILNSTDTTIQNLGTAGVAPFATFVPSSTLVSSVVPATSTATGAVTGGPGSGGGGGAQTSGQPATNGGGGKKSNAGAIAGGIVGGVVGLALILGAIFLWRRHSKKKANANSMPAPPPMNEVQTQPGYPQQTPTGGYPQGNPQFQQAGYPAAAAGAGAYGQQSGYENYGQAPYLPNKGVADPNTAQHNLAPGQYPQNTGYGQQNPITPASEMPGSPTGTDNRFSSYGGYPPSSPGGGNAPPNVAHPHRFENTAPVEPPVELPGHQ